MPTQHVEIFEMTVREKMNSWIVAAVIVLALPALLVFSSQVAP